MRRLIERLLAILRIIVSLNKIIAGAMAFTFTSGASLRANERVMLSARLYWAA